MGIAGAMQELTRDIASSRDVRARQLEEIYREAQQINRKAGELVQSFSTSRGKAAAELRRHLAGDKSQRTADVGALLSGARGTLRSFHVARAEMASGLRKDLGKSAAALKSDVEEMLKSAENLIRDFSNTRRETSAQLHKDLAESSKDRKNTVERMRKSSNQDRAQIRSELQQASNAWKGLASRRNGHGTSKADSQAMEGKLLAAIASNPQGVTLSELACSFGTAPIVLARTSKRLLDNGQIRKESKIYFPVSKN